MDKDIYKQLRILKYNLKQSLYIEKNEEIRKRLINRIWDIEDDIGGYNYKCYITH